MIREAGCNGGRPRTSSRQVEFHTSIKLPSDWDHSNDFVNATDVMLDICAHRIAQQCTYHKKPLGIAVCYECGHLLWSTLDMWTNPVAWAKKTCLLVLSCTQLYSRICVYCLFGNLTPFHPSSMLPRPLWKCEACWWVGYNLSQRNTVSSKPVWAWTDVSLWVVFKYCQGSKRDSVLPSPG